jgi:hypothetical protein
MQPLGIPSSNEQSAEQRAQFTLKGVGLLDSNFEYHSSLKRHRRHLMDIVCVNVSFMIVNSSSPFASDG